MHGISWSLDLPRTVEMSETPTVRTMRKTPVIFLEPKKESKQRFI
jgi:hypothetical protein